MEQNAPSTALRTGMALDNYFDDGFWAALCITMSAPALKLTEID
jgi:hypothetical protein